MVRRIASWVAVVAWASVIFFGSAQPGTNIPGRFSQIGHFGEYAIFGGLLAFAMLGERPWRAAILATVAASLYAITDEYHQSFVPMRTPDVWDWAIDTVGALVGASVVVAVARARGRRRLSDAAQTHRTGAGSA